MMYKATIVNGKPVQNKAKSSNENKSMGSTLAKAEKQAVKLLAEQAKGKTK